MNENLVDVLSVDCPACGADAGQVCTEMPGEHGPFVNVADGVTEHFPAEVHRERFLAVARTISAVDQLADVSLPDGHPRVVNIRTDREIKVCADGMTLRSESIKCGFICDGCEQFKTGGYVATTRDDKRVRLCYPCHRA